MRQIFNAHLRKGFNNYIPREAWDIESEWAVLHASIAEVGDRTCGRKDIDACHGDNP